MATERHGDVQGLSTPPTSGPRSPTQPRGLPVVAFTTVEDTTRPDATAPPGSLPVPLRGSDLHPEPSAGDGPPPTSSGDAGVSVPQPGHAIVPRDHATRRYRTSRSPGRGGSVHDAAATPPELVQIGNKRTRQDRKDHPSGMSEESDKQRRPLPPTELLQTAVRALTLDNIDEAHETALVSRDDEEQASAPMGMPVTFGADLLPPTPLQEDTERFSIGTPPPGHGRSGGRAA